MGGRCIGRLSHRDILEQPTVAGLITQLPRGEITLLEHFAQLLRKRARDCLEPWLQASQRGDHAELVEFAKRLRQDRGAVEAGCTLEWSRVGLKGSSKSSS
jgi:transposase